MELRDYLLYLKRYIIFIVLFSVICGGVAWYVTSQRPSSYEIIQSYEIELVNRVETPDYQYGSYYDLKGAELFTQHLVSLLHSAAVIEDIYQEAEIGYEINNLSRFTNQFKTNQDSNQHFTVTFGRFTEDEAIRLAKAMTIVLTERVQSSQIADTDTGLFQLRSNEPVVIFTSPNQIAATIIAIVAGLGLAVIMLLLKQYLSTAAK